VQLSKVQLKRVPNFIIITFLLKNIFTLQKHISGEMPRLITVLDSHRLRCAMRGARAELFFIQPTCRKHTGGNGETKIDSYMTESAADVSSRREITNLIN